jgi:hypothetical protein
MVGGEIIPFVNKLKEPYEDNHYKSQSKKLDFTILLLFLLTMMTSISLKV